MVTQEQPLRQSFLAVWGWLWSICRDDGLWWWWCICRPCESLRARLGLPLACVLKLLHAQNVLCPSEHLSPSLGSSFSWCLGQGGSSGVWNVCHEPELRGDGEDSWSQWSVPWQFCMLHSENAHLRWSTSSSSKAFLFSFQICSINVKVIWLKSEMAHWKLIQTC